MVTFLLRVSLFFVATANRGFAYYYAVFRGDITALTADIKSVFNKQMPEIGFGGLAATVQGLGMLALIAASLSGTTWFLIWVFDGPFGHEMEEIHEIFTTIIQLYAVCHGLMGLIKLSR